MSRRTCSVYERLVNADHSAKLYYFDEASSSLEVVNLLQNQPKLFGTYDEFCRIASQESSRSTVLSSLITLTTKATAENSSPAISVRTTIRRRISSSTHS